MAADLTATELKLSLLAWLLPRLELDEAIASELTFLDGNRRADLAVVSERRLCAIEIKGPRDNLDKLSLQVVDYQRMFLEVYVATSARHLKGVREAIPRSVGLISVVDSVVSIERTAFVRQSLSKQSALAWLSTNDLRRILRRVGITGVQGAHKDQLREIASAISTTELSRSAVAAVRSRISGRHEAFVREMGLTPTLDDLRMLTLERRIVR